jgi:hypothetical protein
VPQACLDRVSAIITTSRRRIVGVRRSGICERISYVGALLLNAQLLGEFVVVGISCQVLELTGYFLLLGFLTSAAHLTP